jgi:hypothetical protein
MAAFHLIIYGRFWVITKDKVRRNKKGPFHDRIVGLAESLSRKT